MSTLFETSKHLESGNVRHGFFGRKSPAGTNFNMSASTGGDPQTARANRACALELAGLGTGVLALSWQVHGTRVRVMDRARATAEDTKADGMVTAETGVALGILTADCVPVLLADAEAGVIGACHAGWRSAVGGVVKNTVDAMVTLGARPDHIKSALGPAISANNYEVGPLWAAERGLDCPAALPFIHVRPGGLAHFDLPGFVARQIAGAGIAAPARIGGCTFGNPERYFSHRHTQKSGSAPGRQISIIGLVAPEGAHKAT
ncbi:MAG: laccase domain-containing protein [Alphaproteobacteria bacterium]|nr:laccase domain-containing protein [Alphaproteobacteria bacterium]